MLHYSGDEMALELGAAGKKLIPLYAMKGAEFCLVPFMDVDERRKRFIKYQQVDGQWLFVDLVDQ
jgi:hypothetical protein